MSPPRLRILDRSTSRHDFFGDVLCHCYGFFRAIRTSHRQSGIDRERIERAERDCSFELFQRRQKSPQHNNLGSYPGVKETRQPRHSQSRV